jgi:hypothetical protein
MLIEQEVSTEDLYEDLVLFYVYTIFNNFYLLGKFNKNGFGGKKLGI